jgi:hypothetical protein
MPKNPNSASYKSSDPAQMKQDPLHKAKKKPSMKMIGNPPLIQQMPDKSAKR